MDRSRLPTTNSKSTKPYKTIMSLVNVGEKQQLLPLSAAGLCLFNIGQWFEIWNLQRTLSTRSYEKPKLRCTDLKIQYPTAAGTFPDFVERYFLQKPHVVRARSAMIIRLFQHRLTHVQLLLSQERTRSMSWQGARCSPAVMLDSIFDKNHKNNVSCAADCCCLRSSGA